MNTSELRIQVDGYKPLDGNNLMAAVKTVGSWQVSGILSRTDITDTVLVDDPSTGESAIVTYLLPSVLPGTKEYDLFIETGKKLKELGYGAFIEEARVRNFRKRLCGVRIGSQSKYNCSSCSHPLPETLIPSREADMKYCPNCNARFGYEMSDIWLPAIVVPYCNHISLKHLFLTVQQHHLQIPNGVFAYLICQSLNEIMSLVSREAPLCISSSTVIVTDEGRVELLTALTGKSQRNGPNPSDVAVLLAEYFQQFISFVPDASKELRRYFSFPGSKTIQALCEQAKSVRPDQVVMWLHYVQPAMYGNAFSRSEAYLMIQGLTERNEPSHKSVDGGEVKTPQPPIHEINQHKIRVFPFAAGLVAVIFIAVLSVFGFSLQSRPHEEEKTIVRVLKKPAAPVIKSAPPKLNVSSASGSLKQRVTHTAATVRVLVSTGGAVEQIQWLYASQDQKQLYTDGLRNLRFHSAMESGKPVASWTTVQLPLR